MALKAKLPIGVEDFEKIRTGDFFYIDKTGLIVDLLQHWGEVNLFTRPRRFGKSLNMSMLKSFFEIGAKPELFEGLEIGRATELCQQYMGKFPVIALSLKGVGGANYETARTMLADELILEARRFTFLLDSPRLNAFDKEYYREFIRIGNNPRPDNVLMNSLKELSRLLEKHYEHRVIILIDEYDVPLAKAFEYGYYESMVLLIRGFFEQTLKTNPSLYFSVLTGCLRVSRESIFTGMNNLRVLSLSDVRFDEYFGFSDGEVRRLLDYYGLSDSYETIQEWYDGYRFGNMDVYCPWDVVCYCDLLRADPKAAPQDFWANTRSNDIIRRLLNMAGGATRREIELLIDGGEIVKDICHELTYGEIYASVENVWSVLLTTGYLTARGMSEDNTMRLAIPNKELRDIFIYQVLEWFKDSTRQDGAALDAFCNAFKNGDTTDIESRLNFYLKKTISIRDTSSRKAYKENFYHGILLGLLSFRTDWEVTSNKETGEGFCDIFIESDQDDLGIIIELKYADDKNLEKACQQALAQIETKNYGEAFRDMGIGKILKFGIAFYQKRCRVLAAKAEV